MEIDLFFEGVDRSGESHDAARGGASACGEKRGGLVRPRRVARPRRQQAKLVRGKGLNRFFVFLFLGFSFLRFSVYFSTLFSLFLFLFCFFFIFQVFFRK